MVLAGHAAQRETYTFGFFLFIGRLSSRFTTILRTFQPARAFLAYLRLTNEPAGGGLRHRPPDEKLLCVLLGTAPAHAGFDEVIDSSVKHGASVAHFMLSAQVLNHLIGLQHVGAHLVTP